LKKIFTFILSLLLLSLLIVGCNSTKDTNSNSSKEMNISNVAKYKDSYVGDNSAIFNILWNIPGGTFVKNVYLDTKKQPYSINIDYGIKENSNLKEEDLNNYWDEETMKKVFLNNATTLFILIKNVDIVTFSLDSAPQKSLSVTRKDLEEFYSKDLTPYAENTSLWQKEILDDILKSNDKIENFYKIHIITVK